VHVVGGVFWVGAMAVIAWFLIPAAQAMGPQGGALLRRVLLDQRLSLYLIGSMGATLVSGGMLYGRLVGLGGAEWASSRFGVAYAAGAAASLLAVLLRFTVGIRTQNRMAAVGAEMQAAVGPPPPALAAEMGTLQRRSARIAGTSATLLLLAAAAMAVARYL
jgi:hypothetical protein